MSIMGKMLGNSAEMGRIKALGDVADLINTARESIQSPWPGEQDGRAYNQGYRQACRDITAKILELLKAER